MGASVGIVSVDPLSIGDWTECPSDPGPGGIMDELNKGEVTELESVPLGGNGTGTVGGNGIPSIERLKLDVDNEGLGGNWS